MEESIHTFDIWGCCISRDSFGIPTLDGGGDKYGDNYEIKNYFQACSPLVQLSEHVGPDLSKEGLKAAKRWKIYDYNKCIPDLLSTSGAEWLILDTRSFGYEVSVLKFDDGSTEMITKQSESFVIEQLKKIGINTSSMSMDSSFFNFEIQFEEFINFIHKRYDKNIILIESYESSIVLDKTGSIKIGDCNVNLYFKSSYYAHKIMSRIDCYLIKSPHIVISDENHKWGSSAVHYVEEWYHYVRDAIELIVATDDDLHIYKQLDQLYVNCSCIMADILAKNKKSSQNTIKRALFNIDCGNVGVGMSLLEGLVEDDVPISYGWIGRVYRDGRGVKPDFNIAADWMRKAANKNVGWAKNELFDILWRINTDESKAEMLNVIKPLVDRGDGPAMGRMGRAYRDGRGVQQDLNVAADWMRKAASKNVGWAKNELFDILWRIDTEESKAEMLNVIKPLVDRGDGPAMGRMGRAYRDGRGVQQDLNVAADWMRKSANKNVGWAKNELFDILWRIDTEESRAEMIKVAKDFADKGDPNAMGRLGRAYRDGKGVEKDIETARGWFTRAVAKNKAWGKELTALPPSE